MRDGSFNDSPLNESFDVDVDLFEANVERVWECLRCQGEYIEAALKQQTTLSWANEGHPEQETRLHQLAALEWFHEDFLKSSLSDPPFYLETYLERKQAFLDAPIPSRKQSMDEMKTLLEDLLEIERLAESNEAASEAISLQLESHIISSLQCCPEDSSNLIETLQLLLESRRKWRQEAIQHFNGIANLVQTLVQFEMSNSALSWQPGDLSEQEGFGNDVVWMEKAKSVFEKMQDSNRALEECRRRHQNLKSEIQKQQLEKLALSSEMERLDQAKRNAVQNITESVKRFLSQTELLDAHQPTLQIFLRSELQNWFTKLLTLISAQASLEELSAEAKKTQSKMENAWICLQNPLKLSDIASLILKVSGNPLIAQSGIPSHQTEEIEVLRRTLEDLSNKAETVADLKTSLHRLMENVQKKTKHPHESNIYVQRPSTGKFHKERKEWISTAGLSQMSEVRDVSIHFSEMETPNEGSLSPEPNFSPFSEIELESEKTEPYLPPRSRKLSPERIEYAQKVLEGFKNRLGGKNPSMEDDLETITVEEHARRLVLQATDPKRLSKMYEGWMPWI